MSIADKPAELSEQVLESVNTCQQAAIDAVRKFVDTVDQTRHDFLHSIVQSADQTLRASAPPDK